MTSHIAGFDISSTVIGWALLSREGVRSCGTFKPLSTDVWERQFKFHTWFYRFLLENKVREFALEEPLRSDITKEKTEVRESIFGTKVIKSRVPMSQMGTIRALYGFAGAARETAVALKIPCMEINQREWRMSFIGVASAPKVDPLGNLLTNPDDRSRWLKAQALRRAMQLGLNPDSDDAAEAVGVLWRLEEIYRERTFNSRVDSARERADALFSSPVSA